MIQGYPHDLGNAHIIWSTETILVVETLDTIGGKSHHRIRQRPIPTYRKNRYGNSGNAFYTSLRYFGTTVLL